MKKFWTILTVALVALGAVACSNNFEDEVVAPVEGISFTAAIDQTRTALEKDGDIYKTVWVGDETIVVSAEGASFEFKNSTAATSTFTCAEAGAAELLGEAVTLTYNKVIDSAKGAAGLTLAGESDAFAAESNITLTVGNAFLKFTSEADVTFTASEAIFGNGEALATTATVEAGEDVLVAVMAADACTLSFAINGVTCKSTTLNIVNNKIYNLGTLEALVASDYAMIGSHTNNWSFAALTPMYEVGDYYVAKNVANMDEFKFINASATDWNNGTLTHNYGADGTIAIAGGSRSVIKNDGNNMKVADSSKNYDVYYAKDFSHCVIIEAGIAIPSHNISCVGSYNNWNHDILFLPYNNEWYVAKGVQITSNGIKVREGYNWDGKSWGNSYPNWITLDAEYTMNKGWDNAKWASETNNDTVCDIYLKISSLSQENLVVYVTKTGTPVSL